MHIFFGGIGGMGIGPLALIAMQAGYDVSGSDKQDSQYVQYLRTKGVTDIHIGQTEAAIDKVHKTKSIDWYVYSSALPKEDPNHPELAYVQAQGIRSSKRDEFLSEVLKQKHLKLIAIAGTHGKTTTTAMVVWLFKKLGLPVSYSVGAKISYGEMGQFDPSSEYFVYECDEFDRNFLAFHPYMSIISGIAWDHPDVYPSNEKYNEAFREFLSQSEHAFIWQDDANTIGVSSSEKIGVIDKADYPFFKLSGRVNRENAAIATQAVMRALGKDDIGELTDIMNRFPGLERRFEKITEGVYSDYAHTPEKIRGALQTAEELGGSNVVVLYEGLHNTRQHFIKDELAHLFDGVKKLYIVPSYRAREDESLEDLTPEKLVGLTSRPEKAEASNLDESLKAKIQGHAKQGDLVLALSAGGGQSLDEWLREEFK